MTDTTPNTSSSFRARIAACKNRVATPVAAALALGALTPTTAEAVIYTVAAPAADNLRFDPLDGSTALGSSVSAENPLFFSACVGAFLATESALHSSGNFFYVAAPAGWAKVATLEAGTTIDASSAFYDPGQFEYSTAPISYDGTTPRYVGFRYTNQGVGNNETYFGWVEFIMPNDSSATVTRFAIGGNGQAIVTGLDAGAVPEPATASLLFGALALGAAAARRRRR
jgi:hypothetical protein